MNELSRIASAGVVNWFLLLRLYGPLEAWFDEAWRPGEIELVP